MNVAIEETIESAAAVAGVDDFEERLGQSAITDLVSHRAGKDTALKLGVEASVPRREAARQVGYREDLRHASQTPAPEGQAARDAAQQSVSDPGGHPVEGHGELVEHVLGISAELLVGSLPAQHHAHVLLRLAAHEIGGDSRRLAHRFVVN